MGYELDIINELIDDVYNEGLFDTYGMNRQQLGEQSNTTVNNIDKQIQKLDDKLRITPEGKKRASLIAQRNNLLQQRQTAIQQYNNGPAGQAVNQPQSQAPARTQSISPAVAARFQQGIANIVNRANQGDQKAVSFIRRMIQQMGV